MVVVRFDIITLFPDLFAPFQEQGITRRAYDSGQLNVQLWPLRDFADDAYRRVDDRPFGGGPGMVLLAQPLQRALQAALAQRQETSRVPVVHFTPGGRRLDQAWIEQLAGSSGAILLCGRYEGVDQRVIDEYVTDEISAGDLILSGGELPALMVLDAVARLQAGVLTDESAQQESFSSGLGGLLEGPTYSRPEKLPNGRGVPEVLLSGHHARIERWRREQSLRISAQRRPDLLEQARRAGRLSAEDEAFLRSIGL